MNNKEIIEAVVKETGSVKSLADKVKCDVSEIYRIMQGNRKGTEIMLKIVMMYPKYKNEYLGGFKNV
jgi:predicted transcriptional regulator